MAKRLNLHISNSMRHRLGKKRLRRCAKNVDSEVDDHSKWPLSLLRPNVILMGRAEIPRWERKDVKFAI